MTIATTFLLTHLLLVQFILELLASLKLIEEHGFTEIFNVSGEFFDPLNVVCLDRLQVDDLLPRCSKLLLEVNLGDIEGNDLRELHVQLFRVNLLLFFQLTQICFQLVLDSLLLNLSLVHVFLE